MGVLMQPFSLYVHVPFCGAKCTYCDFNSYAGQDSLMRPYADAVARNDSHNPGWYYRLGFALFRAGRFEEAVQAFRQTSIIQKPYGMSMKGLAAGSGSLKLATHYAEYLETLPIQDKVIMY